MIKTIGITKSYGELKVLKESILEIREKEVVRLSVPVEPEKQLFFR